MGGFKYDKRKEKKKEEKELKKFRHWFGKIENAYGKKRKK